jgi:hypothetical protein
MHMVFTQEFIIFCNDLTGTIPRQWESMVAMREFNIAGNGISGSIPEGILLNWPT